MNAGKGDTPRPVDKERFDANYDRIDWKKKIKKELNEKVRTRPSS